jgi:DNA-binding MarR family transcriptional regulator
MSFDLEAFLPYRLNRAAEVVALSFAREYEARYGLSRPEWRTLAALGSVGRMTATDVGAHARMHKTKVSRAVAALEERRWLRRADDTNDRRVAHIVLTPAGERAYREMIALARTYEQTLLRRLGKPALERLEAGLSAIEASLLADEA